ncbi:unnamed protein product [Triticum turgidum subsp. durum]|uniref:Uncharacterized protein n=1 Tax=Triticum turgidum subsp. durum TaxID=4567 RepID=A0A9R1B5W4_TRITD|nr:unnamed protein product [Triticum turgidum subsp. durum]
MSGALAAVPTLTQAAKEELEWVKKEYFAREQMALGKIKEGVIMAIEHPGIAAGSAAVAGIVLLKRPRSYLIQRVRRVFVSKENINDHGFMKFVYGSSCNSRKKIPERMEYTQACSSLFDPVIISVSIYFSYNIGMDVHLLREEGRAIQSELKQISDIENQAVGLKGILDQLPRAHASEFRSEISSLASQVKKEKRVLNSALTKIVNYGVPI